ncbi:MAG: methyltransferase domain-containing protein [Acidobacteriota bacterium]
MRIGESNRFRGLAVALDGPRVDRLVVSRHGTPVVEVRVDVASPELASLPGVSGGASRFEFDLEVDGLAPFDIAVVHEDGALTPAFVFDAPFAAREAPRLARLRDGVSERPAPPGRLIAVTQGGENVEAYRDSIVSGLLTSHALLAASGASPARDVLDVGCGTGRLLLGWHVEDPARSLVGVDVDGELIGWNRENLPAVARWETSGIAPPLDFPDASFDLVQLVSVLTHLPLALQRDWMVEVRRLLRPGGSALVTLHGPTYDRLVLGEIDRDAFRRTGYVEMRGGTEGTSAFATFHSPDSADELFRGLGRVTRFPRGSAGEGPPSLFPIASLQDVYVLSDAL